MKPIQALTVTPENLDAMLADRALIASGAFMVLSAIFPGDFDNRNSTTMIVHTIGSLGSFVAFLVAAAALPRRLRQVPEWRRFIWPQSRWRAPRL